MSISLMTTVWRMDLTCTEKMVLLALADAANDDGVTWIALRSKQEAKLDLMTKCSLSERAIQNSIKKLCEAGFLSREERPGKGVIYCVTPAGNAPPHDVHPARDDMTPAPRAPKSSINLGSLPIGSSPNHASRDLFGSDEPKATKRATRLPDDWEPCQADINFALKDGLTNEEIDRAADEFRDYWRSRGAGGAKTDWSATWRNHVRRIADRKRERDARMARSQGTGGGGRGIVGLGEILSRRRAEEPY
jgi:hypothetical protein